MICFDSISQNGMKVQSHSAKINGTLQKKCIYCFICHKSCRVASWKWGGVFDGNNRVWAAQIVGTALIRSCWFIAVFIDRRTICIFPGRGRMFPWVRVCVSGSSGSTRPTREPPRPEPTYREARVKSALCSSFPDDLAVRLSSAGPCAASDVVRA